MICLVADLPMLAVCMKIPVGDQNYELELEYSYGQFLEQVLEVPDFETDGMAVVYDIDRYTGMWIDSILAEHKAQECTVKSAKDGWDLEQKVQSCVLGYVRNQAGTQPKLDLSSILEEVNNFETDENLNGAYDSVNDLLNNESANVPPYVWNEIGKNEAGNYRTQNFGDFYHWTNLLQGIVGDFEMESQLGEGVEKYLTLAVTAVRVQALD